MDRPSGAAGDGRFDVSSVVAVEGVGDDALREALLELLGGGEEPHPEFWEQGVFTDTTTGDAGRGGYGLRAEALEALCADEPPPEVTAPPTAEADAADDALAKVFERSAWWLAACSAGDPASASVPIL